MNKCDHTKYITPGKSSMSIHVADIYRGMLGVYRKFALGKSHTIILDCGCAKVNFYNISGVGFTRRLLINNERYVKP